MVTSPKNGTPSNTFLRAPVALTFRGCCINEDELDVLVVIGRETGCDTDGLGILVLTGTLGLDGILVLTGTLGLDGILVLTGILGLLGWFPSLTV